MNNFNWLKAVGFGVVIWAILFFVVWATTSIGIFSSVWTQVVIAVIAAAVTYAFAGAARASDMGPALGYGVVFAVVGVILDLLISRQYIPELFNMWTYYLTYVAILFVPPIEAGLRGGTTSTVAR